MRRLALLLGLLGLLAGLGPASALALAPVVLTGSATSVTATTATVAGTVDPSGAATSYVFEYGPTAAYGQQTAPQMLASGLVPVGVTGSLTGLTPGTTYHFRVTATNATGPSSGLDQTFTTPAPTAHTGAASAVAGTTATVSGTVNPAGVATIASVIYGPTTGYGSKSPDQPVGSGTADVPVSAMLTGLTPATTYHYQVVATYTAGGATVNVPGADRTFVTGGSPAASSFAVTTSPAGGNTDLATSLTIGVDPAGTPVGVATTVGEALPSQFTNQLASFGTCAAASFNNVQGPTAANCPDRTSILGVATVVTRSDIGAVVTSDQGFVVKTGTNQVAVWWHTPATTAAPAGGFGQAPGVVSQETGAYGPVVSYNFTSLAAATRLKQFAVVYQRNAALGKSPFAATACAGGAWQFQARIGYLGAAAPELATATVACGLAPPPQPSKLQLARATITGRVIDILAPISRRASGNVSLELYSAGQRFRWTAPINSVDGRIRNQQVLPASQANNGGTGILTIRYAGNAVTRPQVVRLRAGSVPAVLDASRPTLVGGHLVAHGTISPQARGVVRVQLEYYSNGLTTTLERFAKVSNGAWSLDYTLTAAQQAAVAARRGPVESYILFTGYFPRRMRGEMIAYQVLGG